MVAYDAGNGPAIYVTGFGLGNPTYTDPVRRWDGQRYAPVGTGLTGGNVEYGLSVLDDGTGARVHYVRILPNNRREMMRWPGPAGAWEPVPKPMFHVSFPEPGGYVIPRFSTSRPGIAGLYGFMLDYVSPGMVRVTRWEGDDWKKLGGTGAGNGLYRMAEYFAYGRWNLLVSGGFSEFAGIPARALVRWNGEQWHAMGECPGADRAIMTWDDGTGPSLYVGYTGLQLPLPLSPQGIARWTGREWASVGGGLHQFFAKAGTVWDMAVFDDGTGPALFVVGRFDRAGGPNGIPARNVAKWDGQQWHALGAGVGFADQLAVADDGRGPSLFVSGAFSSAGGGTALNIAQWVGCAGNRQCYPDCDNNRHLNANDFLCFITKFAARDPYANCDVSTVSPAINAADFQCFFTKFAAGCP